MYGLEKIGLKETDIMNMLAGIGPNHRAKDTIIIKVTGTIQTGATDGMKADGMKAVNAKKAVNVKEANIVINQKYLVG